MTIQTAAQSGSLPASHKPQFAFASTLLAVGFCAIGTKKRRMMKSLPIVLGIATIALGTIALTACGGGGTSVTPPPQDKTFTITVTGTSASAPDATARFTLVVK
jgi:hypothetical protein